MPYTPTTPRDAAARSAAITASTTATVLSILALMIWTDDLAVRWIIIIGIVIENASAGAAAIRSFLRGDDDPLPGGER